MKMSRDEFWFWFGVWTSILMLAGAGTVINFSDWFAPDLALKIAKACIAIAAINNVILTAAKYRGYLDAKAAAIIPDTAMVVKILLVAFALSLFLASGSAQAQVRRDPVAQVVTKLKQDFTAKTGVAATGDLPFDLLQALDKKLLPDLQYGLALAQATGSKVTAPCYQAWIDIINTQQTAVQTKNADGTMADMPLPDIHLITDFERMVELRNALQPDSDFMRACSPVANMVKQDVVQFMGIVISGGAGLATLVPGL